MPFTVSRLSNVFRTSRNTTATSKDTRDPLEPAAAIINDHSSEVRCLEEADFVCAVCFDLLFKPVVARCGHDFCQECYLRCKTHAQGLCPMCRKPFGQRTPNVCHRLEQTIAALFPRQHQARLDELLPPAPEVSKPSLISSVLDRFWSSLSLPTATPAVHAPLPSAPPSEATDVSSVPEVLPAVPAVHPQPNMAILASSAVRLVTATAWETGLIFRRLDDLAVRYRYVMCVAAGCALERYIHSLQQA